MIHLDNKLLCTWDIGYFETNPTVYGTIFQQYLGYLV